MALPHFKTLVMTKLEDSGLSARLLLTMNERQTQWWDKLFKACTVLNTIPNLIIPLIYAHQLWALKQLWHNGIILCSRILELQDDTRRTTLLARLIKAIPRFTECKGAQTSVLAKRNAMFLLEENSLEPAAEVTRFKRSVRFSPDRLSYEGQELPARHPRKKSREGKLAKMTEEEYSDHLRNLKGQQGKRRSAREVRQTITRAQKARKRTKTTNIVLNETDDEMQEGKTEENKDEAAEGEEEATKLCSWRQLTRNYKEMLQKARLRKVRVEKMRMKEMTVQR